MENKMIKVLAVDDKPDNLIIISALVKEAFPDAAVFTALTGQKGFELAERENPDVILLDIIMPGMDGFELCRKLKADKRLCDIPVVFVTAIKADRESRIRALECGAEAFLTKPIDETELTAQIRAMVKIKTANVEKRNENERLALLVKNKTVELKEENEKRKKSESALLEAQRLAHIGSYEFDMASNKLLCTDEGLRICGIKRENFPEEPDAILNHIHPEDREQVDLINDQSIKKRVTVEYNCRLIRPDGEERVVSVRQAPVFNEHGLVRISGTVQDITKRINTERALHESERSKAILLSNLPGMAYRCEYDNDWTMEFLSEGCYELTGYKPEALIDNKELSFNQIIAPEYRDALWREWERIVKMRAIFRFEYEIITATGKRKWVYEVGQGIYKENGDISALEGIIVDITERKKMEYALKKSEEKFQLLFNKAPLGYQCLDIHCNLLDVNQQWLDLLGYTRNEVIGKCFIDFLPDEYREGCRHCYQILTEHGSAHSEFEFITKNGTRLSIAMEAKIAYDTERKIKQIHCLLQDITEQKRAQEALKESENTYRTFIDASADMVFLKDDRFRHIVANQNLAEFFQKSKDEVIGKTDFDLMPEYAAKQCREADMQALAKKAAVTSEEIVGDRVFETIKFPVELKNNQTGVGGFIRDITERKRMDEELNRERDRAKMYLDTAAVMLLALDIDGTVTLINRKGCELLGYEQKDIVGKNWIDNFIPEKAVGEIRRVFNKIIEGDIKNTEYHENDVITASGEERLIAWHNTVLRDNAGNVTGMFCSGPDITERKQKEIRISQLNRLYATLSQINQVIVRIDDQDALFKAVCNMAIEFGQYRMAWVGRCQSVG